jgi:hypothetical protein
MMVSLYDNGNQIVDLAVGGSSPLTHPSIRRRRKTFSDLNSLKIQEFEAGGVFTLSRVVPIGSHHRVVPAKAVSPFSPPCEPARSAATLR